MLPGFLVVLFWIWFAVGAAILIYRLVTTGSFRAIGTDDAATTESERRATAERHAAFEAQLAAFAPPKPSTVPAHQVMADGTVSDTDATSASDAPATERPEPDTPERDIPAARPASPDNPDGLLPAAARAKTLAEALEGIRMPSDLVPVPDERPNPRHMFFATTTTPANEVGTSLADELERLGFDLIPLDERSIAAVQPTARVEVRILPDDAEGVADPVRARLAPGSVITEFQLA